MPGTAQPLPTALSVTILFNRAHLVEHYEQWVAVLGPGLRQLRLLRWILALSGLGFLAMALLWDAGGPGLVGLLFLLGAAGLSLLIWRHREAWLRQLRLMPLLLDRRITLSWENGQWSRSGDASSNLELDLEKAQVTPTPKGYLLRLWGRIGNPQSPVVAPAEPWWFSLYIPHGAIEPPVPRDVFLRLLTDIPASNPPA